MADLVALVYVPMERGMMSGNHRHPSLTKKLNKLALFLMSTPIICPFSHDSTLKMNTCFVHDSNNNNMYLNLPRPIAPPGLLENLVGYEPLVIQDKQGSLYYWFPSGLVKKNDVKYKTLYTWNPAPTLKEVLEGRLTHITKSFYRFYSDGSVTWHTADDTDESHWSPDPVGAQPVDGVVVKAIHNCYECDEYNPYSCTGSTCDNYYTQDEIEYKFNEDDLYDVSIDIECPECRGPYDGYAYGGRGCSRDCAYSAYSDYCDNYS